MYRTWTIKVVTPADYMVWPPNKSPGCEDPNASKCYVLRTFGVLFGSSHHDAVGVWDHAASDDRAVWEWWIAKDVEGRWRGPVEVLSRNLSEGTEKNHDNSRLGSPVSRSKFDTGFSRKWNTVASRRRVILYADSCVRGRCQKKINEKSKKAGKLVGQSKNAHFMFSNFFSENSAVYEIIPKKL